MFYWCIAQTVVWELPRAFYRLILFNPSFKGRASKPSPPIGHKILTRNSGIAFFLSWNFKFDNFWPLIWPLKPNSGSKHRFIGPRDYHHLICRKILPRNGDLTFLLTQILNFSIFAPIRPLWPISNFRVGTSFFVLGRRDYHHSIRHEISPCQCLAWGPQLKVLLVLASEGNVERAWRRPVSSRPTKRGVYHFLSYSAQAPIESQNDVFKCIFG